MENRRKEGNFKGLFKVRDGYGKIGWGRFVTLCLPDKTEQIDDLLPN